MVISKFNQENDIPRVLELLNDDEAIKHRFQNTLSRENDFIYVAELNGLTVGILIINIQSKRSVAITIYVNMSYRNLGIGSKLCLHADQLLQETPYIYAECEMEANDVVAKFLEKRGYIRSYTVLRMERDNILISPIELSDSSLAKRGIIIRSYRDSDYLAYHNIVNVGFYIMRKKSMCYSVV